MKDKSKMTLLIVVMCLCCMSVFAIDPPAKVKTFYSGMEELGKTKDFNAANTIQQRMSGCFMASENSGINLEMDGLGSMSSTLYTMKLHSMIFDEKTLKTVNTITSTELAEQPDQSADMQRKGAKHYISHITKTYVLNGTKKTYYDVVSTLISNGLITEMANEENITNTDVVSDNLTVEQLRARAAYCYSKGLNIQAYDYYEQLMKKEPTDGDAAYRIALLTFWRKGCRHKFRNRKDAEEKAKTYMEIAKQYGNSEIKEKAENVSKNWENKNVYF